MAANFSFRVKLGDFDILYYFLILADPTNVVSSHKLFLVCAHEKLFSSYSQTYLNVHKNRNNASEDFFTNPVTREFYLFNSFKPVLER